VTRALIAGAGIAGLSAALALAKSGFEAIVFERARELAEFGAGLQITPNASRILRKLGALGAALHFGTQPEAIVIRRGSDNAELARLPLADAEARWGAPYFVIHRADLQGALVESCLATQGVDLRLGFEVAGVAETATGVSLGLKRGLLAIQENGDFAIGADGLRSRLRERLGFGKPEEVAFSGRVAFRATVAARALPKIFSAPFVNLRLGPRAHLVHYPIGNGAVVNLVATIEAGWREKPDEAPWDGEADLDALRHAFASWSRESRDLVAQAENWRAWPLYVRPPIPSYASGRIALVGDAAHPMVPFLAQGAGQAIEDAGVLARCLNGAADIPAALAAYSAARAPRAGRVQRDALAQAKIYHMSGPLALARDLTMRALGPERLLQRYDWIYSA
jgi:salicylate hydroxylase